jgi:hypothetical protein
MPRPPLRRPRLPSARSVADPVVSDHRQIAIGDIELETTDGQKLVLRRVARPKGEPRRILAALGLEIPERLSPDRIL